MPPVTIAIKRLDPDLPLPTYAHQGDAGLDLYAAEDRSLAPLSAHSSRRVSRSRYPRVTPASFSPVVDSHSSAGCPSSTLLALSTRTTAERSRSSRSTSTPPSRLRSRVGRRSHNSSSSASSMPPSSRSTISMRRLAEPTDSGARVSEPVRSSRGRTAAGRGLRAQIHRIRRSLWEGGIAAGGMTPHRASDASLKDPLAKPARSAVRRDRPRVGTHKDYE